MELHKTQEIVAKDNHDFRVLCCGRQWGKTTFAVQEMMACAYSKGGKKIAYFATTYDQARNIAWAMLKESTRPIQAKAPNESRLELQIISQDGGISEISLRGFENIETARGQQFDFLIIDEVAFMRNWKYAWEAILEPTLAFRHGKALFISTPQGFNFFYDMFQRGQVDNQYWKSWRFTSYDNPYLPTARIEQAKKLSTEDYFQQEYMADFRKFAGLALRQFDRNINLIAPFEVPNDWHRGRGFDYGSNDPTASVRVAIDKDDNWFVERCYKEISKNETIKDHAMVILSQDYGLGFIPVFGDPTGDQWEKEFDQYKIHIKPASKEIGQNQKGWVAYTIETLNQRFKPNVGHTVALPDGRIISNAPKLFILNTPENMMLVKEIELLKWKETAEGQTTPILDEYVDPDGHSDLTAALRYFAVSYKKTSSEWDNINEGLDKKWRI
jgi:hypothetical protein